MKYKKNEAKHKADHEPTAKDNLMKDYRAGVIASLKARWWLYLIILIAAVVLAGFSESNPLWLTAPLLGGLLIGFMIIKDNTKTIKMIRAEAKKKSKLTSLQRTIAQKHQPRIAKHTTVSSTVSPIATYDQSKENVPRGLLFASAAIPISIAVYLLFLHFGLVTAISSFLLAFMAVKFYTTGAKAFPVKGFRLLIALIIVGVFLCFMADMVWVALQYYDYHQAEIIRDGYTKLDTVIAILLTPESYAANASNLLWGVGFAVLGLYGPIKGMHIKRKSINNDDKKLAKK